MAFSKNSGFLYRPLILYFVTTAYSLKLMHVEHKVKVNGDVAAATVKIKIMDNGSVLKVYTRQT